MHRRITLCFRGTVLRGLFTLICIVFTFLLLATPGFPVALIVIRKKEIGMLQAIGMSDMQLQKMLQLEGLF